MNRKISIAHLLSFACIAFISIFAYNSQALAQNVTDSEKEKLSPPSEEDFQASTDLAVPWRSSGCHVNFDFNEPNCYIVKVAEYRSSHILTLYNADGSLWYRFSVQPGEPSYFMKDTKMNFLPFSTDVGFIKLEDFPNCGVSPPVAVILRMVGESKNWYEVEINEETKATKFVLKSDRMWAKTSWSYWLFKGNNVEVDTDLTKLFDKPNGEAISKTSFLGAQTYQVLKVESDWIYVQSREDIKGNENGWIRWRKGRDILVGSIFTGKKIPDLKSDDN